MTDSVIREHVIGNTAYFLSILIALFLNGRLSCHCF